MIDEIKKFFKLSFYWIIMMAFVSLVFFIPIFSDTSLTVKVLKKVSLDLKPSSVEFITTDPFEAFISLVLISVEIAFIISFPFLIYAITRYLSSALHPNERKGMFKAVIPSSILFVAGCVFAYKYIIPITFKIMYEFGTAVGATQFFLIGDFVYVTMSLMVLTGILFLLPVFMVILSLTGLVPPRFWLEKWRYSLLFCLVFSAIVTPDGTGVTMVLLSLPLIALYTLGCIITLRNIKK